MDKLYVNVPGLIGNCNGKECAYPNQLPVRLISEEEQFYVVQDPFGNKIKFIKGGLIEGDPIKWDRDWSCLKYGGVNHHDLSTVIANEGAHFADRLVDFKKLDSHTQVNIIWNITNAAKKVLLPIHYDNIEYRSMFCDVLLNILCYQHMTKEVMQARIAGIAETVYQMLLTRYVRITDIDWSSL